MARTMAAPTIAELLRYLFAHPFQGMTPARSRQARRTDDVVTIGQLRASPRVRYWVPAHLMDEFLCSPPRPY